MTTATILWIYIALLLAGGLMGFLKAKSKASLIASASFAVVLSLFALNILPIKFHAIVLLFLLVFFGMRLAKSKKFMPNGLMTILTLLTLVATFLIQR